MSENIKNAKIGSVFLGIEDHGILTMYIGLDYGGSGQSFGGYCFGHSKDGKNYGAWFIRRVLDTVGVMDIGRLEGKIIRVKATHSSVDAIGHAIEDKWFNPKEEWTT